MFLASSNKSKRLLHISYLEQVEPEELQRGLEDLKLLLAELPQNFRLLVDFSRLEFMAPTCAAEVGLAMEIIDRHGVELVVRVIPDSSKDIGMNILSIFHYTHRPRIVTCETITEAAKALGL
ncbi:MAG: hypothetical protein ABIR24_07225 [Verrucomicrobiota bacterium]